MVEQGERIVGPLPVPTGPALALQRHLPSLLATLGTWLAAHCMARQPRICSASEPELVGITHASNGLETFGSASGPGRTRTPPLGGL